MIQGIDEVGRGAWAGPLVVASVICDWQSEFIFDEYRNVWWHIDDPIIVIGDSKKLSKRQRETSADWLVAKTKYKIKQGEVGAINDQGIRNVWDKLVKELVNGDNLYEAVVDGNWTPKGVKNLKAVVKADQSIWEVAAASVIAKVYRDRLMEKLAIEYPGYGWERNVGYGTREHREAIGSLGLTNQHRKLWVRKLLAK